MNFKSASLDSGGTRADERNLTPTGRQSNRSGIATGTEVCSSRSRLEAFVSHLRNLESADDFVR